MPYIPELTRTQRSMRRGISKQGGSNSQVLSCVSLGAMEWLDCSVSQAAVRHSCDCGNQKQQLWKQKEKLEFPQEMKEIRLGLGAHVLQATDPKEVPDRHP